MSRRFILALFSVIWALGAPVAQAADRVALVIGNARYSQLSALNNTGNDARAVAQALSEMGFATDIALDADEASMRKAIRNFTTASAGAALAVVFYAGHGVQVDGENYILPTDFDLPRAESDIKISGIKVDDVLAAMRSRNRIVLLDACRDNPGFGKRMAKATRAVGDQGLAPIKAGDISGEAGVFIAFATAAGKVAQDGDGGHSPFTQALLENMKKPVSIDDMFSMVTRQVSAATGNAQRPYKYASLDSIVCLTGECGAPPQVTALAPVAPGRVRGIVPGAVDLNDRNWLLVAWNEMARGYIEPRSIKKIGGRMVAHKKIYAADGAISDIQIAFECKTGMAGSYAGFTIKDGQKVPKSEFLFAPDVIPLQPITKGSFYDAAAAFACEPGRVQPETPEDVVFSPDWIDVARDAQAITWSVLPSSIKKAGKTVAFLARQEAPADFVSKPLEQIASLDAALPSLYAVVVLKGSVDCDAAELRSLWSEGWTKDRAMTAKVISEESLPPLKITANKVVADIAAYVCTKAGRKLVIQ